LSQIYKSLASGPTPPAIPTQFTTDIADNDPTMTPGTAVPAANNLNVSGRDTTQDNDNGIRTDADADNSDNLYVELTNRLQGTTTVVGAVTGDIITFALSTTAASVYRFQFIVSGRDTASGDGATYTIDAGAKTDGAGGGAVATMIATPFIDADEDASLNAALIDVIASGNNIILQATGVAARTINYKAVGSYVVV